MEDSRPTLIYDATCRLCVFSKKRIEQWDIKKHIRFLPFQDKQACRLAPELAAMKSMDAMLLVDTQGSVSSGVSAFRRMLPVLPMGWAVELFFKLPGFYMLATKMYRVIAKNRYYWFGKCP